MLQLNTYPKAASFDQYKQTAILTATPSKIILMLYEGSLKFMTMAINYLKQNKFKEFGEYTMKAQRIFVEMKKNLNFEHDYEMAMNLDRLYSYIDLQLSKATIKKDETPILEAMNTAKILKTGWEAI